MLQYDHYSDTEKVQRENRIRATVLLQCWGQISWSQCKPSQTGPNIADNIDSLYISAIVNTLTYLRLPEEDLEACGQ